MSDAHKSGFKHKKRRPSWGTLIAIALFHVVVVLGLARAFAPQWTGEVVQQAESLITVTITAPKDEPPPPAPEPEPEEGAQAPEAKRAKPKEVVAAKATVPKKPEPLPPAASTGKETKSGAAESGEGSGGGGLGDGTGSGRRGDGQGNALVPVTKPSVRSGELDDARDFPRPEGGRQARFGRSVTVHFIVTKDGRARNCRVVRSAIDAESTALVCPLVMQKIRFNPAKDRNGNPIEAPYGYRVDFRAR